MKENRTFEKLEYHNIEKGIQKFFHENKLGR